MTDVSKAPDLWELIKGWIYSYFGISGLVILFLLLGIFYGIFYVYRKWDKVKKWPGVASVVSYITRWPVPRADPHRFSVLVAHLENDANREHEHLILEGLKEFEGILVRPLDQNIPLEGPDLEEMERRGHEEARGYLKQSGASVLIWGKVLPLGSRTALKLYWTSVPERGKKWERYEAPRVETQFRLPELFWSDLAEILRLLVATGAAQFQAQEGRYVADQLPPFIARVRTLLKASPGRPGWDPDARGASLVILGNALKVLGDQSGKNEPLEGAVAAFRGALKEWTRERVPLNWAMTQNNLGNALQSLGERESGTKRLEEAVVAYREALKEYTRERVPLNWAATQNNLGNALWRLGERESGTGRLEEAVAAYREALQEYTRERVPLNWAMTQNNLGNALQSLGERESGTKRLEEAVVACREALQEYTRERVPLNWAMTQNNLGNALQSLGERESGTGRLEEAVAAYREALQEQTRERVPLQWAMTQNNLGNALLKLAERESGTGRLEEGVAAYKGALEVFESAPATYYVEKTQGNLRQAETLLQERRNLP
jgi:tetratricopeptide (TPR) repeat protein